VIFTFATDEARNKSVGL